MINKIGGKLYLRQPLKYDGHTFVNGSVGFAITPRIHEDYAADSDIQSGCSVTLDATNYKAKISGTIPTTTAKFFNAITTQHGGVDFAGTTVSRVFNRNAIPNKTDCFFLSNNMGSSNGEVTVKIPSAWTPEDKEKWAKADVYVLNVLNTGGVGTAKFRYATYPFYGAENLGNNVSMMNVDNKKYLYSETASLCLDGDDLYAKTGRSGYCYSVKGAWAESRIIDSSNSITFVLDAAKDKIHFYTDPTLMILDRTINLSVALEKVTYANGKMYGINNNKVYKIDVSTGVATELTGATQSGSNCFIMGTWDQSRVYCIVDGNVKIIHTSNDSVTTPANSLPGTPAELYKYFMIDCENNLWYSNKKYDKDTIAELCSISATGDYTHYGLNFINSSKAGAYGYHRSYDLDGNLFSGALGWGVSNWKTVTFRTAYSYKTTGSAAHMPFSPNDLRRRRYREELKDWRIWNGTSWVKGWYEDETPTGTIDGANKTFTCQNVPTALLGGKLSISVDGGAAITDDGDGTLSDGGTVTYATGEFTLATAPSASITVYYELTSNAITGLNKTLQDGVVVDFENGVEAPHFVEGDYFSFTVAEGYVVDNLEEYSANFALYILPFHDEANETFTINATSMNVSKQSVTGFIKLDSDIGLTGTIAGTEATITTSQTPDAGSIGVDYDTGALFFNAADNGKQAIINYRWLERP